MARLGRIERVSGNTYRDLDTGRFIPFSEARPIIEQARYNAYLGQTPKGNFAKAADTFINFYGLSPEEANQRIASYRSAYKTFQDSGYAGDEPTLSSDDLINDFGV